jgi:hypothetical protein
MNAPRPKLLALALANAMGALLGVIGPAACAAEQKPPPAEDPCQKLTGAERTECERPKAPPAEAKQDEPPPPDTKSEGNDQSDTADPPQR